MPTNHARLICWVLLLLGLLSALVVSALRLRLEHADRTVSVVLDYGEIETLAAAGGFTTPILLSRMKAAGATGLAVAEQTLGDVLSSGEVYPVPPAPQESSIMGPPAATLAGRPLVIRRLHRSLTRRLGLGLRTARITAETPTLARLAIWGVQLRDLADVGFGYPDGAAPAARGAQLEVVARPRAEGNQWASAAQESLALAKEEGARLVVFSGNTALGYPDGLSTVASAVTQEDLLYGYVEFGKQYGDLALAARLPGRFLRVHSINETEMLGMSVGRAIDRFVLGVRERNIRVCYVRLFPPGGQDPVALSEAYVRSLCDRLESHGFTLGTPVPLPDQRASAVLRWLVAVGALAALALCLLELLGSPPLPTLLGLAAFAVLALPATLVAPDAALKGSALLAALALPTLALGRLRPLAAPLSRWPALGRGLLLFASSSGLSIVGGLLVVGCLADTRFMVKLDQFAGVKVAHLLPVLAVLLLQLGWDLGTPEAEPGERPLPTLLRGWRIAALSVVRYWHAALLLLCAGGIGLMVLRSGNEAGSGVPGFEIAFRSTLGHVFGVRPRTKEVLIGHPLLILALARMAGGRNLGRWLLLALGAIGQVSIVNTFTHLHTPLAISLTRTLHGLWVGSFLGIPLYLAVEAAEALCRRRLTSPPPSS